MRSVCQKKSRPKKTHTYVERIARLYIKKQELPHGFTIIYKSYAGAAAPFTFFIF